MAKKTTKAAVMALRMAFDAVAPTNTPSHRKAAKETIGTTPAQKAKRRACSITSYLSLSTDSKAAGNSR